MMGAGTPKLVKWTQGRSGSLTVSACWLLAAKTLAFLASFVLPLLLVRLLNQAEFGMYKQVFLLVATAISVFPLGFAMSAFYFLQREPERQGQVVFNILIVHGVIGGISALVLLLYPEILGTLFNNPEITEYAYPLALVILLWVVSSALEIIGVAHQEVKAASLVILATHSMKALLFSAVALCAPTVRALIYAAVVHGCLQLLLLILYLRSRFGFFWRRFDPRLLRAQLSYALPLGFSAILYWLQLDIHHYVVSYHFGAAVYAIYAIGCMNIPLVGILTESVSSVVIPKVNALQFRDERREILLLLSRMMRKLAAVYFPLYAGLLVLGHDLITLLFTSQYSASWPIFAVNLTLIPLGILAAACDAVIRAYPEHHYFVLKTRGVLLAVLVMGLWFVTSPYGLMGAITVVVGVNLVERLIVAGRIARALRVRRSDLALFIDLAKLALAALIAGTITRLAGSSVLMADLILRLLFSGAIFSAIYGGLAVVLGVPTPEERHAFLHLLRCVFRRSDQRQSVTTVA